MITDRLNEILDNLADEGINTDAAAACLELIYHAHAGLITAREMTARIETVLNTKFETIDTK